MQRCVVFGAQVEFDPALGGDSVDAGPAAVSGSGEHGPRLFRQVHRREAVDELADGVGWVRAAPVGPGVATGAACRNTEATAAESLVDDAAEPASINGNEGSGVSERAALGEQVLHAPQIAGSFFAHREGEENRVMGLDVRMDESAQHDEPDRQPTRVVGDAGTEPAGALMLDLDRRIGTEDGVNMSGDDDGWWSGVLGFVREPG